MNIQCRTALAAAAPSSSMEHTYNFIFMSCSGFDSRQRTSSQCIQRRSIHSTVDCQSIVQTECQSSRQAASTWHRVKMGPMSRGTDAASWLRDIQRADGHLLMSGPCRAIPHCCLWGSPCTQEGVRIRCKNPGGFGFTGSQGLFWKTRRLLECPDSAENRSNGSNERLLTRPNGIKGLREAVRGISVRISAVCWRLEATPRRWRPGGLGAAGGSGEDVSVFRDGYTRNRQLQCP